MIEILPALPCEPKPINPADRFIDLVAMKRYGEWLVTRSQREYDAHHARSFSQRHDNAVAWCDRRDNHADRIENDYGRDKLGQFR